jgi:glucuronoarabinoxylan endo-1,4-beta-xylanase
MARNRKTPIVAALAVWLLPYGGGVPGATVTIDTTVRYQTVEGFGGYGGMNALWSGGPFVSDEFTALVIDTLGLTLHRHEIVPPGSSEATQGDIVHMLSVMRALKRKADASGVPLGFLGTVFSPPGYMKSEGSEVGGHLLPQYYDAYGDYLVDQIRQFKDSMGVDMAAVSPGNEPGMCYGWYSMCDMPAVYGDIVIAVAHRLALAGVAPPITYPESPWWPDWDGQALDKVSTDRIADSAGAILSIHYSASSSDDPVTMATRRSQEVCMRAIAMTGSNPNTADANAGGCWGPYRSTPKKMRLWDTEFGGQFDSWQDGLVDELGTQPGNAWTLAEDLYLKMYYGYNAVIYWQLCEARHASSDADHYALMYLVNGHPTPGPLFYVYKNYARYIRPGAVRIGCTSSDTARLYCVAFRDQALNTTTVVLLNEGNASTMVSVQGAGLPPSLDVYQTSPTQNCVKIGSVAPGGTVTLPVRSVTTLCNAATVSVRGEMDTPAPRPGRATAAAARLFGVDGRALGPVTARHGKGTGIAVDVDERGIARSVLRP